MAAILGSPTSTSGRDALLQCTAGSRQFDSKDTGTLTQLDVDEDTTDEDNKRRAVLLPSPPRDATYGLEMRRRHDLPHVTYRVSYHQRHDNGRWLGEGDRGTAVTFLDEDIISSDGTDIGVDGCGAFIAAACLASSIAALISCNPARIWSHATLTDLISSVAEAMVLGLIPIVMILDHYRVNTVERTTGRRRLEWGGTSEEEDRHRRG